MARMIPEQASDFHGSRGEMDVYDALSKLGNDYTVLHSYRWLSRERNIGRSEGEADFLIFHPERGILVIEVKGGTVKYHDRQWFTVIKGKQEKPIADPDAQASISQYKIQDMLREANFPRCERCLVGRVVWLTQMKTSRKSLPPHYHPDMLLDNGSFDHVEESIERAYEFASKQYMKNTLSKAGADQVLQLLLPDLHMMPSLAFQYKKREHQIFLMTEEQARIIDFLEDQQSAVISGPGGSGKTMVAIEKAKRLAAQGGKVLFLCYNVALKKFLKECVQCEGLTIDTFHGVADKMIVEYKDFEHLISLFLQKSEDTDFIWEYTDVIVDEGQDFANDWLAMLETHTPNTFYIFYDQNQLVQQNILPRWITEAECRLRLNRNCRSTSQIFRTAHSFIGIDVGTKTGRIDGPKPLLHDCATPQAVVKKVQQLIRKAIKEYEAKPEEIAVLTMEKTDTSVFAENSIDGISISDQYEKGSICRSTVRKFKGLEAKVIIIVDAFPAQLARLDYRRRLYTASTRAKQQLHILFQDCNDEGFSQALGGILSDEIPKANAKVFAKTVFAQWYED